MTSVTPDFTKADVKNTLLPPVRTKRSVCSGLPSALLQANTCFSSYMHGALKTQATPFEALCPGDLAGSLLFMLQRGVQRSQKVTPSTAGYMSALWLNHGLSSIPNFGATVTHGTDLQDYWGPFQAETRAKQQNTISCHDSRFHFLSAALQTTANRDFQPCIG